MGKSIAIAGSIGPPETRDAVFRWVEDQAHDLEWGLRPIDLTFKRASLRTPAGKTPLEMPRAQGIALLPHFACEELPLICVGQKGILVDEAVDDAGAEAPTFLPGVIVKTQFAGPVVHREICEFLHQLRDGFAPSLAIDDETGYFATRDEAALGRAFDEGWSDIREKILEDQPPPGSSFQVGQFLFEVPVRPSSGEFGTLTKAQSGILVSADRRFVGRFGGFGTTLDHSRASILDFELAISDLDESTTDRHELETLELVSEAGAYFGRTLIAVLGGSWKEEADDRLVVSDLARTGLVVDPFEVAQTRIAGGPPFSFVHHLEVYETIARHLAREKTE